MKKIILIAITLLFLSINFVSARDIEPVKYNKFGETEYAIDLDSIKKVSDKVFSVEVLVFTNEITSKDDIYIIKYEINTSTKQFRMIESFSRSRKNWKIAESHVSNAVLVEAGKSNWKTFEDFTPIGAIYWKTALIGLKGKKYYIDSMYKFAN